VPTRFGATNNALHVAPETVPNRQLAECVGLAHSDETASRIGPGRTGGFVCTGERGATRFRADIPLSELGALDEPVSCEELSRSREQTDPFFQWMLREL